MRSVLLRASLVYSSIQHSTQEYGWKWEIQRRSMVPGGPEAIRCEANPATCGTPPVLPLSPGKCSGNRRALIFGRVHAALVRGVPLHLDAVNELLLGAVIRAGFNRKRHIQDVAER
ncbi:MAG: hypothetical protein WBJ06_09895 [Candidatus Methanoculleus thermohydrogenotrophicum]|nr:hypothetical protein [Candidatus Methanoculleus thermohydrogenotrophicum]